MDTEISELKPSRYNMLIPEGEGCLAFNAMNCALAKVNEEFLEILANPNGSDINRRPLRDNMLRAGFLINNEVDEIKLLEFRQWKGKFAHDALTVTILPTDACNFSCFYCFEHKKNIYMDNETINATVEFVKSRLGSHKELKICWFGGEPLLAANVVWEMSEALISFADSNSCQYTALMVTNGYLIDEAVMENLKRFRVDTLQITLDGDESSHDKRRCTTGRGKTFKRIFSNIEKLLENGFKVSCRVNVDKSNADFVKPLLYRFSQMSHPKENLQISFGQILPIARLDEWDTSICLSAQEYSDYLADYINCMADYGLTMKDVYPFYPVPKANFCGAVQMDSFVVRPTGIIDKCLDCDLPVGDVRNGIAKSLLFENNLARWMTWNPFDDKVCRECQVLPICMGGCPYFSIVRKQKLCLKWKTDLEESIRQKYARHLKRGM